MYVFYCSISGASGVNQTNGNVSVAVNTITVSGINAGTYA